MMNYIWGFILILSIVSGLLTEKIQEVSNAVITGATDAVNLVISILGMMTFWTGIMNIAEKSGITYFIAKIFTPIMKFLFPDINAKSKAIKAICMNLTANLLGLGNAATPFGISAMKEMQKLNKNKSTASKSMIMFTVMNTASLQLIPTFILTIREKYGSKNPFEILPCIWICSFLALLVGIIFVKIFERFENKDE